MVTFVEILDHSQHDASGYDKLFDEDPGQHFELVTGSKKRQVHQHLRQGILNHYILRSRDKKILGDLGGSPRDIDPGVKLLNGPNHPIFEGDLDFSLLWSLYGGYQRVQSRLRDRYRELATSDLLIFLQVYDDQAPRYVLVNDTELLIALAARKNLITQELRRRGEYPEEDDSKDFVVTMTPAGKTDNNVLSSGEIEAVVDSAVNCETPQVFRKPYRGPVFLKQHEASMVNFTNPFPSRNVTTPTPNKVPRRIPAWEQEALKKQKENEPTQQQSEPKFTPALPHGTQPTMNAYVENAQRSSETSEPNAGNTTSRCAVRPVYFNEHAHPISSRGLTACCRPNGSPYGPRMSEDSEYSNPWSRTDTCSYCASDTCASRFPVIYGQHSHPMIHNRPCDGPLRAEVEPIIHSIRPSKRRPDLIHTLEEYARAQSKRRRRDDSLYDDIDIYDPFVHEPSPWTLWPMGHPLAAQAVSLGEPIYAAHTGIPHHRQYRLEEPNVMHCTTLEDTLPGHLHTHPAHTVRRCHAGLECPGTQISNTSGRTRTRRSKPYAGRVNPPRWYQDLFDMPDHNVGAYTGNLETEGAGFLQDHGQYDAPIAASKTLPRMGTKQYGLERRAQQWMTSNEEAGVRDFAKEQSSTMPRDSRTRSTRYRELFGKLVTSGTYRPDPRYTENQERSPTYSPQSPKYVPKSPVYVPKSPEYTPQLPQYKPESPGATVYDPVCPMKNKGCSACKSTGVDPDNVSADKEAEESRGGENQVSKEEEIGTHEARGSYWESE